MATFGREVTPDEAHDYVERCKAYRDSLIDGILPLVPANASDAIKTSQTYYDARINAWLFDVALVKGLFEADPDAKYFAVFLGATIDLKSIVVLTSLKEKSISEPNKLLASAKTIEQPGAASPHSKFPNIDNGPIDLPS
ncbi:MAG TPA: hypothetical protein VFG46_27180 [Chryseolinea sp.]|nr:hypothetical protein [Chryseolinea sp.]